MTNDKLLKYINSSLKKYLPKDNSNLSKAMRYSLMAGGKRIRPILCLEAAKLFGVNQKYVIPAACAIEMIHTFTLIHDDLPAMDNSDLRRGLLTCHKKFGEDIAILAGDALNTLAFVVVSKYCPKEKVANVSIELGDALLKVIDGQVIDLESENKKIDLKTLKNMHTLKTASLISAVVKIGAILAGASNKQVALLANFGNHLGLAFQIADDILDVTKSTKELGKPAKLDLKNKKSTYVSLLGLEKAIKLAEFHKDSALAELESFGKKADNLREIAESVIRRIS